MRGCGVELGPLAGKGRPDERQPLGCRRLDGLVRRVRGDQNHRLVEAECLACRVQQRNVPEVRRVERPAEEPDHGTNWNESSPTSTAAPRRAPASRSARSSSSSLGGVPTTRKPSSVRSRLHGRAFGSGR